MNRGEFLTKLREALSNELSASVVQENIDYYNNYISEEIGKGHTEESVIGELGDPWMIARTIIDGQQTAGSTYAAYETGYENEGQRTSSGGPEIHAFGIDTWWKKLLAVVGVVLVIILVLAIVTGILGLIAPILIPVLVVVFVIRILGNR